MDRKSIAALLGGASVFALSAAHAAGLPSGGHYVSGKGEIGKAGQSLTVKQSSTTGIIDWNRFSIGSGNSVSFNNGSGATLNRVTGGNLSTIAGSMHATGSLYLMNSAGVIVSGTGRIVTGGSFTATTSDNVFGSDANRFKVGSGSVVNNGTIISGGTASFRANTVTNSGTIHAARAILRAGQTLVIDGNVAVQNADGSGGTVIATAKHIAIGSRANISASGTKGGKVLVGGDIHGGSIAADNFVKQNIRNAESTAIAAGAQIGADGSHTTGGNIVIWSNGRTTFDGAISAKGQTAGGFAEVSSHELLGFTGSADLTGASGNGTLLLDPKSVTIGMTGDEASMVSGGNSLLNASTLMKELATASVDVTTSGRGDITIAAPIKWSNTSALTLDAGSRDIVVDAPITVAGGGRVNLVGVDSYGLGPSGFAGSISFTDMSADPTLTMNGRAATMISNIDELQDINSNLNGVYALNGSINASGHTGWVPLGTNGSGTAQNSGNGFAGSFDGMGHTISNLVISTGTSQYSGLFGYSNGLVENVGVVGGSVAGGSSVGGIVGYESSGGAAEVLNSYSTASVTASGNYAGGVAGYVNGGYVVSSYATGTVRGVNNVGGLIGEDAGGQPLSGVYATGSVSGGNDVGGLVGYLLNDTISSSYATGTVSGTSDVGGLVGLESGSSISRSYAIGAVTGGTSGTGIGGLVGGISYVSGLASAAVSESYATGKVTGGASSTDVGGLVGNGANTIEYSYAMGAVSGGSKVGGLVGYFNNGGVDNSYAVGVASGTSSVGGLIGYNDTAGIAYTNYWDTETSGKSSGIGTDLNNQSGNVTGLTTAQLQGSLSTDFTAAVFGTSSGLFPYFNWQYSSAPQAISGIAYTNNGVTPVSTSTSVKLVLNGADSGSVSPFANGYYYFLEAPGTIASSGTDVLTYTSTGASLAVAKGTLSSFDIWGSTLIAPTADTTYSTASATSLQSQDASLISASEDSAAASLISGLSRYGYIATGSSFTMDESGSLSTGLFVATTGGNLTVAGALVLPGANGLTLISAGSLNIDGQVTVTGAGHVTLGAAYDTTTAPGTSLLKLSFASGTDVFYGSTNNGGTLTINRQPYALIYSASDLQNINNNLNGDYALAAAVDASSDTNWVALGTNGSGSVQNGGAGFAGVFEGLGNTISNLNVDAGSSNYAGLFGYASGTIRDVGLVGGSVTSTGSNIGALAGYIADGTIANVSASSTVTGGASSNDIGGLVGYIGGGTIINASASGAVNGGTNSQNVGGLVGDALGDIDGFGFIDKGLIAESSASGAVTAGTGSSNVGGLVGNDTGLVAESSASGAVSGHSDVGGLVGLEYAEIETSYATGAVSGNGTGSSNIGGLLGEVSVNSSLSDVPDINTSYATGTVNAGPGSTNVGGLIGEVDAMSFLSLSPISVSDSYAMGTVSAGSGSTNVGGFAGYSGGEISTSYSTGAVQGSGNINVGGFIGSNEGALTDIYWDTQTSGMSVGMGADDADQTVTGMTTAQLQSALPSGFSATTWHTASGLFPYLAWQFPSGTPQFASGTVYTFGMGATVSGQTAGVEVNGSDAVALSMPSGANGYFYVLLAPGSIAPNSQVLTYLPGTGGAVFYESVGTSLTRVVLEGSTLNEFVSAARYSTALSDLGKATGSDPVLATLLAGLSYLDLYDSAPNFTIDAPITSFSSEVILLPSGNVAIHAPISSYFLDLGGSGTSTYSQNVAGIITAHDLIDYGSGAVALNAANEIVQTDTIAASGNFALTDAESLNVAGALSAGTGTVDLAVTGSIGETGGTITAGTLTGSSTGASTLTGANDIAHLGAFSAGGSLSLTDAASFTTTGTINAGTHTLTLTTTGASHNIGLNSELEAATIDLVSAGKITESNTAGRLVATRLKGSSVSTAEMNSAANTIADLAGFTAGSTFELTDASSLNLDGALAAGTSTVELTTKGASHNIAIDAVLTGGTVKLTSAGKVTESSAGSLDATKLEGSSISTAEMNSATNAIADLAAFTAGSTFELTDATSLTLDGTLAAGTSAVELTTKGSGHNIAIDAALTGGTVDLVSAGKITESSAGSIAASTLTGSSDSTVTMTAAGNEIAHLGAFSNTAGNFSLTDSVALTTTGTVNAGTHTLKIATAGASHNLAVNSELEARTIDLTSVGKITESTAGDVDTALLNVTAQTGIELTSSKNAITKVGTDKTTSGPNKITL